MHDGDDPQRAAALGAAVASTHPYSRIRKKPPFDNRWTSVAKERDWVVVHGTVLSGRVGKRIEQAWCERGESVVDLAMPSGLRILERELYYQAIKPEVRKRYSSDDALFLAIKNGHDGLWSESEPLKK